MIDNFNDILDILTKIVRDNDNHHQEMQMTAMKVFVNVSGAHALSGS